MQKPSDNPGDPDAGAEQMKKDPLSLIGPVPVHGLRQWTAGSMVAGGPRIRAVVGHPSHQGRKIAERGFDPRTFGL